jgi:predicted histone-like DNA-binding protein
MTVKFTTVARTNPQDPQGPKKHYPLVKSTSKMAMQKLAERAAEMSTLSPADMAAAIEVFLAIVPSELADGNIVSLGDFGTFSVRVRGEGSETPEEVTSRNITKTLVTFRPGKRFKEVLERITYEKAKD